MSASRPASFSGLVPGSRQFQVRAIDAEDLGAQLTPTDWADLRYFLTVAEAGSFTAVADQMNVARSAVTRQIELMRAVYAAGVPCFGSCWGIQVGAAAAGGGGEAVGGAPAVEQAVADLGDAIRLRNQVLRQIELADAALQITNFCFNVHCHW